MTWRLCTQPVGSSFVSVWLLRHYCADDEMLSIQELTAEGREGSLHSRQVLKYIGHICRGMQKLEPPRRLMLLS